jgi:hypothetical protein
MSNTKTGGPAFPHTVEYKGAECGGVVPHGGMTLRQYAAIKLKVPDSGDDWLDDMIRKSLRDEFAAKAMQGMLASDVNATRHIFAAQAYAMADAMLEVREA